MLTRRWFDPLTVPPPVKDVSPIASMPWQTVVWEYYLKALTNVFIILSEPIYWLHRLLVAVFQKHAHSTRYPDDGKRTQNSQTYVDRVSLFSFG